MNSILWELRRNRSGLILWLLCQAALICMGYLEFVMVFRGNADIAEVMKQLPPAFMTMMGVAPGVNFSQVGDFFFAMADFGFYVMAAYACLLGFGIVSREKAGKTTEFLYTKPVSRRGILLRKCSAGAICCVIMGFGTILVTAVTFGLDPGGSLLIPILVWGATSLLMELVYFLGGVMFAAACKKTATGSMLNLSFLLGTILVSRVVGFLELSGPIKALGVKYYFPMLEFVRTGSFGIWPWLMCGAWIVLFLAVAFWKFEREDLTV